MISRFTRASNEVVIREDDAAPVGGRLLLELRERAFTTDCKCCVFGCR